MVHIIQPTVPSVDTSLGLRIKAYPSGKPSGYALILRPRLVSTSGTVSCLIVYHSFCRINQMQKPLYLIDIAKLDRYREKALGRYEDVPNIFHYNERKFFWRHPVFFIFIKCKMLHKELWRSLEVWRLPLCPGLYQGLAHQGRPKNSKFQHI